MPDGKIYISSYNGVRYLHIIDKPDSSGIACNIIQHGLQLPYTNFRTIPNFPNFRLGAWKGSPCDSLGIEAGPTINTVGSPLPSEGLGEAFFLSPNPATEGVCRVMFFEPLQRAVLLEVSDALGRVVQSHRLAAGTTYIPLDTKNLLTGMYAISLQGQANAQKMLVINTE